MNARQYRILRYFWTIVLFGCAPLLAQPPADPKPAPPKPNVFALPRQSAEGHPLARQVARMFQEQEFALAEKLLRESLMKEPADPVSHYNLACALARQGKTDDALASLEAAIAQGFRDLELIKTDADLASLREHDRYKAALQSLATLLAADPPPTDKPNPSLIVDGVARVDQDNTRWNPRTGLFEIAFRLPETPEDEAASKLDAIKGHGKAGELVRKWQQEGTAGGLAGILYDNLDRKHSQLPLDQFPQLARVAYSPEAASEGLDYGLQTRHRFNLPTIGNSSTALTAGPFWRSQTRIGQVNPAAMQRLYEQYTHNHLYFYPEHRDFDPGRNGKDGGFGDVFPANTPYVITSQGSSGSDQAFLHAICCTLASFQPKTRDKLVETGLLMPTVQMIFRRSNKQVLSDDEYLTGKAHPAVFQGAQLDVERMVNLAHEIPPDAIPPLVQLLATTEDEARLGSDFFEAGHGEKLFDTPAAIARVYRTTARKRRMVVTAATTFDPNDRDLKFHWSVLQGRPDGVKIKPLKPDGTLVELLVEWQPRFALPGDEKMHSNRIDIGCFAHNGVYWSAPAFVSILCLDDEERVYDSVGRIESITYRSHAAGGNYADPAVHTPRDWRDEYRYGDDGKLAGWTRIQGEQRDEYTPQGELIVEKTQSGEPKTTKKVTYQAKSEKPGQAPVLVPVVAD
ncbi:MAG: hypothetical protein SFU86_01360 [Pirellulaceae bacterium]|nr:hypothetical protein [Pirellulaceae bacterium]